MTHYLDHNACTPVDPRVLERFLEVERRCPGNPGSLHAAGRRARAELERARAQAAAALQLAEDDVFFVSGGTEANNLAVLGAGDLQLPVLLAEVEHPSVLVPAARRGVVHWDVDPDGRAVVSPPERPVGLVCLVHAQSEVGTLQPIEQAAELATAISVPFHVDGAQTLGRAPLQDVVRLATTVALSAHKAGGLRGGGILVARNAGAALRPLFHGGGQERELRPGTESPAMAAATALAVEIACLQWEHRAAAMAIARNAFIDELRRENVALRVLTPPTDSLPNTLLVAFDGVDGRLILPALDMAGVLASQGSACSSGSPLPPRVLRAMGLDDATARRCVRFSFGRDHSRDDALSAARATARVIARLPRQED